MGVVYMIFGEIGRSVWPQIIVRRRSQFLRPRLAVLSDDKTSLRPAH